VGGKSSEVGDQELRGVCFGGGGGGVLLRRFPGRLVTAKTGRSRVRPLGPLPPSGQSPCARILVPFAPATSLHLLSFSLRKKQYLPPEVKSTAHQPLSNFSTLPFHLASIDTAQKPIYRRCPRFSRKELQIGVARYASTKPHACMHAYYTVQVHFMALSWLMFNMMVLATLACQDTLDQRDTDICVHGSH